MAIQCTITSSIGTEVSDAYIRVDTLQGHKGEMQGTANAYLSEQAWLGGAGYVAQFAFSFTPNPSAPLWPQAYAALKDLAPLQDAIDA